VRGLAILLGLSACAAPQAGEAQPLAGVIDFHCHSGPDALPRSVTDLEIARIAKRAGMRGIVLKNHFTMTAGRAALAMREVGGLEVFGGVVLNRAVGGINPEAVRTMMMVEGRRGKVVWLPTFDAENHVRHAKENRPFVPVVKGGAPVAELAEVFTLVAEGDLVLATGHSSVEESLIIIEAAKKAGVKKILVTHAMADPVDATEPQLRRLAATGAILECVWATHIAGPDAPTASGRAQKRVTVPEYAKAIQAVGAEHFLISSDLGQALNPIHTDGLKAFIAGLREKGLTGQEIDVVARQNPARLLGLDP
jgi:microsomal dipeptidase-like Zn-dependent dipeptidase